MTTIRPDESPGTAMTDEDYGIYRASAAIWVGTSVLITDQQDRVLVQHVDYRDTCLLPGGALDKGESPARGAARELHEELGVTMVIERGLAVDWVSAHGANAPTPMRFPGEILLTFEGGTWDTEQIAAINLPEKEITAIAFVEPADLPNLLSPGDARRALAALRARVNGAGAVLLEDGRPLAPTLLDQVNAFSRHRATHHWPWHEGPAPTGIPARQCWGWLFAPDGRVLVLLDPTNGAACLPGGTPEPQDQGDPVATLCPDGIALRQGGQSHSEPFIYPRSGVVGEYLGSEGQRSGIRAGPPGYSGHEQAAPPGRTGGIHGDVEDRASVDGRPSPHETALIQSVRPPGGAGQTLSHCFGLTRMAWRMTNSSRSGGGAANNCY
ncbi:NUDIX domain-containing protein [Streptomyces lydicus]